MQHFKLTPHACFGHLAYVTPERCICNCFKKKKYPYLPGKNELKTKNLKERKDEIMNRNTQKNSYKSNFECAFFVSSSSINSKLNFCLVTSVS